MHNKLALNGEDWQDWHTHIITVGYQHTGKTGEEYGYLSGAIGAITPDCQKLIAKQYIMNFINTYYFVSYTNDRLDGYIAFSPDSTNTFRFSYKDNLYDNQTIWEKMKQLNGQTIPIYLTVVPPKSYNV